MAGCPLGVSAGEFPQWPIKKICDLAVTLRARFIELSAKRMGDEGLEQVAQEVRSRELGIHVNCATSELRLGFSAARSVGAPILVVFDDAVERADRGRRGSLDEFRREMIEMLEQSSHQGIRVAMENQVIYMTRQPEDLLAIVRAVDHPRFGVNYDPDNF